MANRIYAIRNGQASVFAEGEQLENPNGLLVDRDRLIVGSWGKIKSGYTVETPGHLIAIDLKTRKQTFMTPKPFASIDGLESDGRGG